MRMREETRRHGTPRNAEDRPQRGRFVRRKFCRFCGDKTAAPIDYKDLEKIAKFLTEKGKVIARRITGNCAKHQRALARAIKRARHAALLSFQTME